MNENDNLHIFLNGDRSQGVVIENYFANSRYRNETLVFADGSSFNLAENGLTLTQTNGDESLKATDFDDVIFAGDGNDEIKAGKGCDILDGGLGNDRLKAAKATTFTFTNSAADSIPFTTNRGMTKLRSAKASPLTTCRLPRETTI